MKILALNPPFLTKFSRTSRSPEISKGGTLYYPIWLSYATGILERSDFNVQLIDAPAKNYNDKKTLRAVNRFNPDLIILDTSTPSIYNDIKIAEKIKKELPDTFITLVGPHVSAIPEQTLQLSKSIDCIARREYDYTVRDLTYAIEEGKGLSKIAGISYRNNGKIIHNEDRPFINDLDSLPFLSDVYKRHLNIEDYFYSANLHPVVTIIAGRGCPNRCTFCVYPQVFLGHKYRTRSAENIVLEMENIVCNFPQVNEIFFEDDTLPANRKRLKKMCELIIDSGVNIKWSCNARADLSFPLLKLMNDAGCRLLCVGYESGCQQILNNVRKGIQLKTLKKFSEDCRRAGILVHGCIIFGLPGETKTTIKRTIKFVKTLNPDSVQFYPVMVYPGTELFTWMKEKGYLLSGNWDDWLTREGVHNCLVEYPHLSRSEILEACDRAINEYYVRKDFALKTLKMVLRNSKELQRFIKTIIAFFKYKLNLMRGH